MKGYIISSEAIYPYVFDNNTYVKVKYVVLFAAPDGSTEVQEYVADEVTKVAVITAAFETFCAEWVNRNTITDPYAIVA